MNGNKTNDIDFLGSTPLVSLTKMTEADTHSSNKVFCACGCDTEIEEFSKNRGERKRFKYTHNLRGRKCSAETRLKISKSHQGDKSYRWKGGRHISHAGYILISGQYDHPRNNNGCVFEHILVMEKHLGRYLWPFEIVHHKNGMRKDNHIENLQVMTRGEHIIYHRKLR